jgi:sugar lactone lactonase YvrE
MKLLVRTLVSLLVLLLLAIGFLELRYGGGSPYPDVSTTPLVADTALERLVALDYPPGNVAVASDARIFFNYHPFAQAGRFVPATMFELVNGMTVDRQQRLWVIEPAGLDHERTRITAFDLTKNGNVAYEFVFPAKEATFAQDLRISPDGKTLVTADTGLFKFTPASLITLDLASKTWRKRLAGHASTSPQDWVIRTPFGPHKLGFGLVTFSVGVDGIEISPDGQWLYFATMSHERLYRVPMAALLDEKLDDAALAAKLVDLGKKPLSDGIALDKEGRVLITDIENGGLARMDAQGKLQTLVKSKRVIWADGVVQAPDGSIVFTDSAIPAYIDQLARPPSAERLKAAAPYQILRLRTP